MSWFQCYFPAQCLFPELVLLDSPVSQVQSYHSLPCTGDHTGANLALRMSTFPTLSQAPKCKSNELHATSRGTGRIQACHFTMGSRQGSLLLGSGVRAQGKGSSGKGPE
jgi:hypothetical protein